MAFVTVMLMLEALGTITQDLTPLYQRRNNRTSNNQTVSSGYLFLPTDLLDTTVDG